MVPNSNRSDSNLESLEKRQIENEIRMVVITNNHVRYKERAIKKGFESLSERRKKITSDYTCTDVSRP